MRLKDFFNEYWKQNTSGLYSEPYIDYLEHLSLFYGDSEDFFLFFIVAVEVNIQNAKLVKWSNVSFNFSTISAVDSEGKSITIFLPQKLQYFLKENFPEDGNLFVFSNPKIQEIENDLGTFFLANMDMGKLKDFPRRQIEFKNSFRHIIQPKKDETRMCLHAWNRVEIGTQGRISPCCNFRRIWDANDKKQVENGYKNLRKSLLNGKLNYLCQNCYIAPVVSKEILEKEIKKQQTEANNTDILSSLPTEVVCISVTEKCNLRCVYCSVSHPDYRGKHMRNDVFDEALKYIYKSKHSARVEMFGHGETTFHPRWREYCQAAIATGRKIHFVTNMASQLEEEDFKLLAQFNSIWVSLDSNDEEMMMQIRRRIRPRIVFEKIEKIRTTSEKMNIKGPEIRIAVVIYDPSIWTVESLVSDIIKKRLDGVNFQTLIELPLSEKGLIRNISHLDNEETIKARKMFKNAINSLKKNGIPYSIASSLICADKKPLLLAK